MWTKTLVRMQLCDILSSAVGASGSVATSRARVREMTDKVWMVWSLSFRLLWRLWWDTVSETDLGKKHWISTAHEGDCGFLFVCLFVFVVFNFEER